MSFSLQGKVRVVNILEHHRTIRGKRDPVTGASLIESVNLGWFIHLEFDGGVYMFHNGTEKPEGIEVGDMVNVRIWK